MRTALNDQLRALEQLSTLTARERHDVTPPGALRARRAVVAHGHLCGARWRAAAAAFPAAADAGAAAASAVAAAPRRRWRRALVARRSAGARLPRRRRHHPRAHARHRGHRPRGRSHHGLGHLVALPRRPARHHGAQHLHGRGAGELRRDHRALRPGRATSAAPSIASSPTSSGWCARPSRRARAPCTTTSSPTPAASTCSSPTPAAACAELALPRSGLLRRSICSQLKATAAEN